MIAGTNAMVFRWHVSHAVPVGICVAGFASAFTAVYVPLWQATHFPAVPVWFIVAGANTVVLWQESHCRASGMWVVFCFFAPEKTYEPLWQVEHCPGIPPMVWSTVAGANAMKFLWQLSHCEVVGRWFVGLAKPLPPETWQDEHRPAVGTVE